MPRFVGNPEYPHQLPPRDGVLLTNLGTPAAPTPGAVRRYLAEFLADRRVVELPHILWRPILHGIILRLRPRRSAAAYRKIWQEQGSPLLSLSERLSDRLREELAGRQRGNLQVALGMRYGQPSIGAALESLRRRGVTRLVILPLYPQYSATTTGTTFDAVADVLRHWRWVPELLFINGYHDEPAYLDAVAQSIREHWRTQSPGDRLLISFHGIPEAYFLAGDPYFCHCQRTARELAERLELDDDRWQVSFQSRFGRQRWLQPYTDAILRQWGAAGVATVDVVCPGFAVDCLETLEEIAMLNAGIFRAAGGQELRYIPALNDHPGHARVLAQLIDTRIQGWREPSADPQRQARHLALKAKSPAA